MCASEKHPSVAFQTSPSRSRGTFGYQKSYEISSYSSLFLRRPRTRELHMTVHTVSYENKNPEGFNKILLPMRGFSPVHRHLRI